jgi:hypothetical protein
LHIAEQQLALEVVVGPMTKGVDRECIVSHPTRVGVPLSYSPGIKGSTITNDPPLNFSAPTPTFGGHNVKSVAKRK